MAGWRISESFGVRDRASQAPITPDTAFRIASMTKSFTALAVLKLRDDGRLSLEDPVSRVDPGVRADGAADARHAAVTIRQLLSHSAGFPEDNPWGDQQLSATDAMLDEWLAKGIPFSTPPGTRYEYSNYAFGLLGRVVTQRRRRAIRAVRADRRSCRSCTWTGPRFEFAGVPAERRAVGYRLKPDGTLRGRAAAAARRVRGDGRAADDGQRSREVRRIPPVGVAAAR